MVELHTLAEGPLEDLVAGIKDMISDLKK